MPPARSAEAPSFIKVIDNFEALYDYITNDGTTFYFKTNLNAPNYRVIKINLTSPEQFRAPVEVVPESTNPLQGASCIHQDKLVLSYLKDVKDVLQVHDLYSGDLLRDVPVDIGTINGPTGRRQDSRMFFQLVSFLSPGTIYAYDFAAAEPAPTVYRTTKLEGFDPSKFQMEQVFYPSKDGTKIPMFLVHKKGIQHNGNRPVYLYGYGGFSISLTPSFAVSRLIFIEHMDGVFALANLRGGGCAPPRGTLSRRCARPADTTALAPAGARWATASTARRGMTPASATTSRTCSTTLSPRPSTWSRPT